MSRVHKAFTVTLCEPLWWTTMSKIDFISRYSFPVLASAILSMGVAVLCTAPREGEAQSPSETAWLLEEGRGIAPEQLSGPTLTRQGQRLSGSTGCNSFTATITATGERV